MDVLLFFFFLLVPLCAEGKTDVDGLGNDIEVVSIFKREWGIVLHPGISSSIGDKCLCTCYKINTATILPTKKTRETFR